MRSRTPTDRRTFVTTALAVSGSLLAGCVGSNSSDDGSSNDAGRAASFGGWFENTANYESVVNKTKTNAVTVEVGAQANSGPYAFAPPAISITTGTTVTWKWTGLGGSHNVVAESGSFESEMASEKGHTFEHTFDSTGTYKYVCVPHESMGMKGVVVVK